MPEGGFGAEKTESFETLVSDFLKMQPSLPPNKVMARFLKKKYPQLSDSERERFLSLVRRTADLETLLFFGIVREEEKYIQEGYEDHPDMQRMRAQDESARGSLEIDPDRPDVNFTKADLSLKDELKKDLITHLRSISERIADIQKTPPLEYRFLGVTRYANGGDRIWLRLARALHQNTLKEEMDQARTEASKMRSRAIGQYTKKKVVDSFVRTLFQYEEPLPLSTVRMFTSAFCRQNLDQYNVKDSKKQRDFFKELWKKTLLPLWISKQKRELILHSDKVDLISIWRNELRRELNFRVAESTGAILNPDRIITLSDKLRTLGQLQSDANYLTEIIGLSTEDVANEGLFPELEAEIRKAG